MGHASSLPHMTTPFIGRETEVARLVDLLSREDCRLLTLVGPGGVGKTRLSLEVAHQMDFVDGVYFVPLQPLRSVENMVTTVIDVLPLQLMNNDDPQQRLLDYLSKRQLLLVLDNFEHLLGGVDIVTDILAATTQIKLLVTSRERLNLQAEQVWPVQGLAVPEDYESPEIYSAVQLFVERSRRVQPVFSLEDEQVSVIRICQLVDGLPLALELAASWTRTLSCETIADEIQHNIDILTIHQHDRPERHHSMRAVFDHSWNLLDEDECAVFCRLAVFRDGFTADAAQRIAGASLQMLALFVDKSLVQMKGNGRYDLHDLLRQYASEHLGEDPVDSAETRNKHAGYYANFAYQSNQRWIELMDDNSIVVLSIEIDNLEAGAEWILQQGITPGELAKYVAITSLYFQFRGLLRYAEQVFRTWAKVLTEHPRGFERDWALGSVLCHLAWALHLQTRNEEAGRLLKESLLLLDYPDSQEDFAVALTFLGRVKRVAGQFQEAKNLLQQSLAIFVAVDSNLGQFMAHGILGETAFDVGDYDEAMTHFEKILEITGRLNSYTTRYPLSLLGLIYAVKREISQARAYLLKAIHVNREMPDVLPTFILLAGIATCLMVEGRDKEAAEMLTVIIRHPLGDTETQNKMRPYFTEMRSRLSSDILETIDRKVADVFADMQHSRIYVLLPPAYFDQLVAWLESPQLNLLPDKHHVLSDSLSSRELEVLALVARGLTNREIADDLYIGISTVKKHINHIYDKLDVRNRTSAVARANELKLLH